MMTNRELLAVADEKLDMPSGGHLLRRNALTFLSALVGDAFEATPEVKRYFAKPQWRQERIVRRARRRQRRRAARR